MKKVIVFGSMGMLGHIVYQEIKLNSEYEVIGVARNSGKYVDELLDVSDFKKLEAYLFNINPDIIINCIGVLIKGSTDSILNAININSYLPHFLSNISQKINCKFIHISTDCVFSGKDGNYTETSFKDGDDNYSRTKSLGEVINNRDLTIRTSIIGAELKANGTGLLDWFLKQNNDVFGYTKAFWSGVTTLELAKAINEFIKQDITGLYHFTVDEKISKYDLLNLFAKIWNKDIKINKKSDYMVDKSLVNTRNDFSYKKLDYDSMLMDYKKWMMEKEEDYGNYGELN